MPITLNPSKLLGTPKNVKPTLGAGSSRVGSKSAQSRTEFDETLARAKSENARGAAKPSRVDGPKSDKKIAKPAKSSKRRTDGAGAKPAEDHVDDADATSVSAEHLRQDHAEAPTTDDENGAGVAEGKAPQEARDWAEAATEAVGKSAE